MKHIELITIDTSLERVWNFIEDPNNLQLWNPKVQRVTTFSNSGKEIGTGFGILYVMNNKASEMRGEVVVREPMSRLTFRYSGGQMPQDNYVEEGFVLTQIANKIRLERTILFNVSSLPLWARLVMWIIFKTGKPVGKPYLETVKEIMETENSARL